MKIKLSKSIDQMTDEEIIAKVRERKEKYDVERSVSAVDQANRLNGMVNADMRLLNKLEDGHDKLMKFVHKTDDMALVFVNLQIPLSQDYNGEWKSFSFEEFMGAIHIEIENVKARLAKRRISLVGLEKYIRKCVLKKGNSESGANVKDVSQSYVNIGTKTP